MWLTLFLACPEAPAGKPGPPAEAQQHAAGPGPYEGPQGNDPGPDPGPIGPGGPGGPSEPGEAGEEEPVGETPPMPEPFESKEHVNVPSGGLADAGAPGGEGGHEHVEMPHVGDPTEGDPANPEGDATEAQPAAGTAPDGEHQEVPHSEDKEPDGLGGDPGDELPDQPGAGQPEHADVPHSDAGDDDRAAPAFILRVQTPAKSVTAAIGTATFTLADDGASPDAAAGDAVFAAVVGRYDAGTELVLTADGATIWSGQPALVVSEGSATMDLDLR